MHDGSVNPALPLELSVLVVTHNRPEKLKACLRALKSQTLEPERFEVILSDDGSSPPATQNLQEESFPFSFRCVTGPCRGPATARNRALPELRAPLTLFLNDDFLAAPDLLEQHLRLQSENQADFPTAVMGTFQFTPELRRDPQHRLAEEVGVLGTQHLPVGVELGPLMFWTGNLSVATKEVRAVGGFDEQIQEPSADDVDLGYRLLRDRGVRLLYEEDALAWHDHPHRPQDWKVRWERHGRTSRYLAHKYQDPLFWPGGAQNQSPLRWKVAHSKLLRQKRLADQMFSWLERLEKEPDLQREVFLEGIHRLFELPRDKEDLIRVSFAGCFRFYSQLAFWETEPENFS